MRLCSDVHITRKYCVSDDVLMRLSESHPYIYDGELEKSMKFLTDSSFVNLSLYCEFFSGTVKVE